MDSSVKKRNAAQAALEFIEPGTILGVGSGSTVQHLIELLPNVRDRIDKVASSSSVTTGLLEHAGFEVSSTHPAEHARFAPPVFSTHRARGNSGVPT